MQHVIMLYSIPIYDIHIYIYRIIIILVIITIRIIKVVIYIHTYIHTYIYIYIIVILYTTTSINIPPSSKVSKDEESEKPEKLAEAPGSKEGAREGHPIIEA